MENPLRNTDLSEDCTQCAALCCIAFAFEPSDGFAFEKAPGTPCKHLRRHHRCGIHSDRSAHGMPGCSAYTCHGAGQYVTQALFQGQSWQDQPELTRPMIDSFLEMARVQCVLAMAQVARRRLPPSSDALPALDRLLEDLMPTAGWTADQLSRGPSVVLENRLKKVLSGSHAALKS